MIPKHQSMRFILVCFFSQLILTTNAQQLLGVSSSNYAGTNSVIQNPANTVDSRHKLYINLLTEDFSFYGNYLSYKAPYSIIKLFTNTVSDQYRDAIGRIKFPPEYISESRNGSLKNTFLGNDFRGPSILYAINDKNGITLSSRLRVGISATNLTEDAANLFRYGVTDQSKVSSNTENQSLAFNANAAAEFAISYGREILRDDDWYLKAGISIKREIGLYSLHFLGQNASTIIISDTEGFNNKRILINSIDADYGYTKGTPYSNFRLTPEWLIGNAPPGSG